MVIRTWQSVVTAWREWCARIYVRWSGAPGRPAQPQKPALTVQWRCAPSPDLQEMYRAAHRAIETIKAAGMADDPRVVAIEEELPRRVQDCIKHGRLVHLEYGADRVVYYSIQDERTLELFARLQALARLAERELQARGWRT